MTWTEIKLIREKAGVSQKDVAETLGLTPPQYNIIENSDKPKLKEAVLELIRDRQEETLEQIEATLGS